MVISPSGGSGNQAMPDTGDIRRYGVRMLEYKRHIPITLWQQCGSVVTDQGHRTDQTAGPIHQ